MILARGQLRMLIVYLYDAASALSRSTTMQVFPVVWPVIRLHASFIDALTIVYRMKLGAAHPEANGPIQRVRPDSRWLPLRP